MILSVTQNGNYIQIQKVSLVIAAFQNLLLLNTQNNL
jgi:hypothetical protein